MTTQQERANRALEAVLAWARAARESDRRGRELFEMRQAILRASSISTSKEDLETAGQVRSAAEVALHDACVREDFAEEEMKNVGRALLLEETIAGEPVSDPDPVDSDPARTGTPTIIGV